MSSDRTGPEVVERVGDDLRIVKLFTGLEKIECYCKNGKTYSRDGEERESTSKVELYKSTIYAGASEENPYGKDTGVPCYRVAFAAIGTAKLDKVGLTAEGLATLEKGISLLKERYPL